jgi:hypothetical protein
MSGDGSPKGVMGRRRGHRERSLPGTFGGDEGSRSPGAAGDP